MDNYIPVDVNHCGLCGEVFNAYDESVVSWTRNSPLISYHYMVCSHCKSYTLDREITENCLRLDSKDTVTVPLSDSPTALTYKGSWKHLDPDTISLVPSRYFMTRPFISGHGFRLVEDLGEGHLCLRSAHIEKYNNTLFWPYSVKRFFDTGSYKHERWLSGLARGRGESDRAIFMYV